MCHQYNCNHYVFNRQEAYKARIQLAIIDHNFHLGREKHVGPSGDQPFQYRRVYRKSSKKWDAIPVLEKKSYAYMTTLHVSFCFGTL